MAEFCPAVPMVFGGAGARRNDAGLDRSRRSADITAEDMCGGGVQRVQERVCRKRELKRCKSTLSKRCHERGRMSAMVFTMPGKYETAG